MGHIFKREVNVSVIKIIIVLSVLVIICLGYFYCVGEANTKINALFGGLLTGFIVALAQLFLSWYEYKKIDKLKQMKVKDIRSNRANREFYEMLIRNARKKIDIMGVTANRFISDFADTDSTHENMRVLFAAMSRGVKIRILIPEATYLESRNQRRDAANVRSKLEIIKKEHSSNFEFKYFNHLPTHSIFVVDDECILGPVFPSTQSKDTPVICLESNSPFAEQYLIYFDKEWAKC